MNDEGYNGWANWETWDLFIWLTNDQATDQAARRIARRWSKPIKAAEALAAWVADSNPLKNENSWYSDVVAMSISRVDFLELAEAFRE